MGLVIWSQLISIIGDTHLAFSSTKKRTICHIYLAVLVQSTIIISNIGDILRHATIYYPIIFMLYLNLDFIYCVECSALIRECDMNQFIIIIFLQVDFRRMS